MKKKIRIFHGLVNYGTQAGLFSKALRNQGIDSLSVSGYDKYHRTIDVTLKNSGKNYFIKIYNYIWNITFKIKCFINYDYFHFYYGTSLSKHHLDLFFYKLFRKKVIFHYLGLDVQSYEISTKNYEVTNMKYIMDAATGEKHDNDVNKRLKFENKYANMQFVCAPYLSEFVRGSIVFPLAIDLGEYKFYPKNFNKTELIFMHAPTDRNNKGTSFIIAAIAKLIKDGYDIKLKLIENVHHDELKKLYQECDIFIDQITAGWYGTAAIEAMAIGCPVVCSIRQEYYKHIDYGDEIPIINAFPDSIYDVLKDTIKNRRRLEEIGKKSREFVENVHELNKLTQKLITQYNKL